MVPDSPPALAPNSIPVSTATQSINYNSNNQLSNISSLNVAVAQTQYAYYADGNEKSVKIVRDGKTLTETDYTYDSSGRLDTVTTDGQTATYHWNDTTGVLYQITTAAGVTTTFAYEANTGRLQSIITTNCTQTAYSAAYTYKPDDQIDTVSVTGVDAAGTARLINYSYTYDAAHQLTNASGSRGGTPISDRQFAYSYDGAGNRTDLGSVNNLNQYSDLDYDATGNLLDDNTFAYEYNALGQLVEAQSDALAVGAVKVTMGYDANGLRIWKKTYAYVPETDGWQLTASLKFSYDGSNLIAEFNALVGADKMLRSYAWGPNGLLSVSLHNPDGDIATTYLTVLDSIGNVTALLDASSGTVVATFDYDPYGNLLATTGSAAAIAACPMRWGGGYTDSETGLIYLQNRYYSPSQGRFLTRDPSGQGGGYNEYTFGNNDPVNEIDPSGLDPDWNRALANANAAKQSLGSVRSAVQTWMNAHPDDPLAQKAGAYIDVLGLQWNLQDLLSRQAYDNMNGGQGSEYWNDSIDAARAALDARTLVPLQVTDDELLKIERTTRDNDIVMTIAGGVEELGARVADAANDALYLASDGDYGSSNQNFSSVSKLQAVDSSQAMARRATFSSVPLVGSGYNLFTGKDLLTQEAVEGWNRVAAGFRFVSDLAFAGAAGARLYAAESGIGAGRQFSLTDRILNNPECFVAGTQVVTAMRPDYPIDGGASLAETADASVCALAPPAARYLTQCIETLRAGDAVVARDQHDPESPLTLRFVEEVFIRTAYQLTVVTIRSSKSREQTLYSTNEHPIYVPGRGWVICRELAVGDQLLELTGQASTVIAARTEAHPTGITVYNMRVAESHTYFVKEDGSTAEPVWVHNAGNYALVKADALADLADADHELENVDRDFYLNEKQAELARPALRADTIRKIEAAAGRDKATGFPTDANTGEVLTGKYDYGHIYGRENRVLIQEAMDRGMTQAEFNDWVNGHSEWFQIESVPNNRGHTFEAK